MKQTYTQPGDVKKSESFLKTNMPDPVVKPPVKPAAPAANASAAKPAAQVNAAQAANASEAQDKA